VPVTITAFQKSAFQNNAFQIATAVTPAKKRVGWGFRHTRKELEQRLRAQRGDRFSPKWFEDFLAARDALAERAEALQSELLHRAADDAADASIDVVPLLKAAASATRKTAALKHARAIIDAAEYDDDEEIIEMLLLH